MAAAMIGESCKRHHTVFPDRSLEHEGVLDSSGNVVGRQGHLPFGEDFGEGGVGRKNIISQVRAR